MKRKAIITIMLVMLMACLLSLVAFAEDVKIGELTYSLTQGETENTATIKTNENKSFTNTDIVIPAYIEHDGVQYRVSGIANFAFKNTNVTTVVFEDAVRWETLGDSVFYNCNSLTSIDFGKAEIKKIGNTAFAFSEQLLFADNRLPNGFEEFTGSQHFDNCNAMTTLIFPESFTYFKTDIRIQSSPIVNLIFEGEMTNVFLQHNRKHGLGGMNVYLTKNTLSQLNGSYAETLIYNNNIYIKDVKGAYTEKTDGTLTFNLSGNDANSGGKQLTLDGVKYSLVNSSQDRIYFCAENKVVSVVRTSTLSGSWTSGYYAVFDANALEVNGDTNPNVTNKLVPHIVKETVVEKANCLHGSGSVTYCYCGYIMDKQTDDTLGEHTYEDDGNCETECICSVCEAVMIEAKTHITAISIVYASGYANNGEHTVSCVNCKYSVSEQALAIFKCLGISRASYADANGKYSITQGYSIDREAYNSYVSAGYTLEFGLVAGAVSVVGNTPLDVVENKVVAKNTEKTVIVDGKLLKASYNCFDVKITSIPSERLDDMLILCLYACDGENVYYISEQGQTEAAESVSYNG